MVSAAQIRQWMRDTMAETGLTVNDWATQSGVARSTIFRALKDDYEFVTSSRTLGKLAEGAAVSAPDFRAENESRSPVIHPQFLPVRYKVQAGNWLEVDQTVQEFGGQYPVIPDPRFAGVPQWLEQVVGDSIDRKIPDGHFAHVVDAAELGYAPADGDFVVVVRTREGGHLVERTIKQVAIIRGRIELWPRSTNPRWNEPLSLANGSRAGEEIEVRVVGKVIGSYNPF